MKKLLFGLIALLLFTAVNAQDTTKKKLVFNPNSPVYEVCLLYTSPSPRD